MPSGFYNIFEAIIEFLCNGVEGSVGKWAKRIFPVVATIFLLIFVANMVKLVPGFESIGHLEPVHSGTGYEPVELFKIGELGVYTVVKPDALMPMQLKSIRHALKVQAAEGEHEGVCTALRDRALPAWLGHRPELPVGPGDHRCGDDPGLRCVGVGPGIL